MAAHQHHTLALTKRPQPPRAHSSRPSTYKRQSGRGVPTKSGGKISHSKPYQPEDDDDDASIMAASFPQFCTFCEKQIVIPSQTILYCSESCRRKDNNKTLAFPSLIYDVSPPLTPPVSFIYEGVPVRDIIPQRPPTAFSALSASSISTNSEQSEEDRQCSGTRQESEAARYLRLFHVQASADLVDPSRNTPRAQYLRSTSSTTGLSTGAPSLSHSPSSTETAMSLPYPPSTRPLPPRVNPFSSSCRSRSIDLVNPFVVLPRLTHTAPSSLERRNSFPLKSPPVSEMSTGFAEAEFMSYEKTIIAPRPSTGSLKQLFRFSDMQAPPTNFHRHSTGQF